MFLQTLNIEWGQIDPKDNRRVKTKMKHHWTYLSWTVTLFSTVMLLTFLHYFPVISVKLLWNNLYC